MEIARNILVREFSFFVKKETAVTKIGFYIGIVIAGQRKVGNDQNQKLVILIFREKKS